jgi:hypothetical protein
MLERQYNLERLSHSCEECWLRPTTPARRNSTRWATLGVQSYPTDGAVPFFFTEHIERKHIRNF